MSACISRLRCLGAVATVALATACSDSTGPGEPTGRVRLDPADVAISGGVPLQLTALDEAGGPATGIAIRWSSLDTSVVTVDSLGLVRAVSFGTTDVIARSGGFADTVVVTVQGWTDLAAGASSTCGIWSDGSAWCWGWNAAGRLGIGTSGDDSVATPQQVTAPGPFADVEVGSDRACARGDAGWICWGEGNGMPRVEFAGLGSVQGVVMAPISGGGRSYELCVVSGTLRLHCSNFGALVAVDTPRTFVHYGASGTRTCRLTTTGVLECSGAALRGVGPSVASMTPVDAPAGLRTVAVGDAVTCALDESLRAWCWRYGQPGDGPSRVPGADAWFSLDAARNTACGATDAYALLCWGDLAAHFGAEYPAWSHVPVRIPALPPVVGVTLGATHGCALGRDGSAWCWGDNAYGQLGDGTTTRRDAPVRVVRVLE